MIPDPYLLICMCILCIMTFELCIPCAPDTMSPDLFIVTWH